MKATVGVLDESKLAVRICTCYRAAPQVSHQSYHLNWVVFNWLVNDLQTILIIIALYSTIFVNLCFIQNHQNKLQVTASHFKNPTWQRYSSHRYTKVIKFSSFR
ncbi:hypothetical protein WN943_007080 [Citrus x changshan-huyou]